MRGRLSAIALCGVIKEISALIASVGAGHARDMSAAIKAIAGNPLLQGLQKQIKRLNQHFFTSLNATAFGWQYYKAVAAAHGAEDVRTLAAC